ncbi:MAG TPA: protein kinase [Ktedonobacteraceae bacterium]|nr:protein kinase [Ktedonobacteraceae bacterium]
MMGIEGTTLGRYELRRCVARGGMSEVYLGYDRHVRRRVAIKVLYGSDEPFVRRFEREALAVGTLSHDHILPLYDFGEQRPWYYLVMPYVEGGTLRDYLLRKEQLSLEVAGKVLEQIASALQHAHDHGVVHRDVKPSNILLRPDGHVYLVDFGLAKAKMEADSHAKVGMVGTPEYMAPEQTNGVNDYRSDIYSLGIILYQMLTGRVPFMADSPVTVSLKHIYAQPRLPSLLNGDIPPDIEKVMLKALAKNPNERYQEARAFAIDYKKALVEILIHKRGGLPSTDQLQDTVTEGLVEEPTRPFVFLPEVFLPPIVTPRNPLARELPSMPSIPRTAPTPQRVHQTLLTMLCLALLGSSILLGLLWQDNATQNAQLLQTSNGTALFWHTATALAQQQAALAAQARVQATAGVTTAVGAGSVLYENALTYPGGGWINDGKQCFFTPQGYHVYTSLRHTTAWCYLNQRRFTNTVLTAQAQLLRGDMYGIVFRLDSTAKAFYVFELNYLGEYRFIRAEGDNPLNWLTLIDWTPSDAIKGGYGVTNTLLVMANASSFRFYVNKQLIRPAIADPAYATGLVGFLVGGDDYGGTEATFNNLWIFQR